MSGDPGPGMIWNDHFGWLVHVSRAEVAEARVAELEASWTQEHNVAGKFEGELHLALARVAELEAKILDMATLETQRAADMGRRVAELETNAMHDRATIERQRHELGNLRATQCDCGAKEGK